MLVRVVCQGINMAEPEASDLITTPAQLILGGKIQFIAVGHRQTKGIGVGGVFPQPQENLREGFKG